MESDSVMC